MHYRLRTLLLLVTASAVILGLLRGVISEPEPYWGLHLIGLTSVCSGLAGILITTMDRYPHNS